MDIQSNRGSINIKGFNVPLNHSLEIRGGVNSDGSKFTPASGTDGGLIATPVDVPGGLLGISFPLPGNAVTATASLAGSSSDIHVSPLELTISVPIKLRLTNPLIGPGCQIGTNSNPVRLNLQTGTTNPPLPNRPISGRAGTLSFDNATNSLEVTGSTDVDNSFSIPGASGCGIGLGLINSLVNARLQLPSAAGNNSITIDNDSALQAAQ